MFSRTRREYRPIGSDSDLDQGEAQAFIASEKPPTPSMSKLAKIAAVLAITCTIFNVAYLITTILPALAHRGSPDLAALPRPNQFIGLERINYTKYPFPDDRIATFGGVIAQIDRSRPKFVYPDDPRRRSTYFGTVSPEDRNVLATNQISTVMQFRTRDFGMEWCKLKLALPDSNKYHPSSSSSPPIERERNWILEGDTSDLEVWELESSAWLDPRTLSYATRPARRAHLFSFRVRGNATHVSREVRCPADKIATFEIFCVSPGCRVDIWQNKLQPPMGLFLEQRSSL